MALYLSEADVREILTMEIALKAVEDSFLRLADGSAVMHSRQRLNPAAHSYLHYMAAADSRDRYMGLKIYTSSPQGLRFLVPLFHTESGDLLALIEADYLGQMRTGAASGFATKLMARADARTLGIIGTGLQARTQLEAIARVRKIGRVYAFGRNAERRAKFAQEMTERLKIPVTGVDSPEAAVRTADILVTSTNATKPVVEGRWLCPGMHINAIGANFPQKRELDSVAVFRAGIIAVDSREQSKLEAGDLIQAFAGDESNWSQVIELAEIAAGRAPGRRDADEITLFKSNGVAIEDIVTAGRIYEIAVEKKRGVELPFWSKKSAADA
ncbi:MAG: ornithine cyclodeaminase family protein [Candidatus Acidiferrales bacterium]